MIDGYTSQCLVSCQSIHTSVQIQVMVICLIQSYRQPADWETSMIIV